ncbi:MAG: hypothetical protein ABI629_02785 [bacterium]
MCPRPPTLSPHRAFVVQFTAASDPTSGTVAGRVEHVQSGHAVHFESLDDLLRFLAARLAAGRTRPEEDPQ